MKKIRLKGYGKTIFIFSLIGIMLVPAIISIGQQPGKSEQTQQTVNTNVTDSEVTDFVNLYVKANEVQTKSQDAMMKAIEKEKLSLTRFNEIMAAQQKEDFENVSAKEMASFNRAFETISAMQKNIQTEVGNLIEKEMGMEKYQKIIAAYEQDSKLQEKIDVLLKQEFEK